MLTAWVGVRKGVQDEQKFGPEHLEGQSWGFLRQGKPWRRATGLHGDGQPGLGLVEFEKPRDGPGEDGKGASRDKSLCWARKEARGGGSLDKS